jgi:hypothetical protein
MARLKKHEEEVLSEDDLSVEGWPPAPVLSRCGASTDPR